MVKIRLTRMGKKHQPSYRIIVTPKSNPRQGNYLDLIGTYNPLKNEVAINSERALEWLNKGAQPSDRVARLFDKAGIKHKSIVVKFYQPKAAEVAEEEAPAAPAAEETTEAPVAEEPAEESPAETVETPEEAAESTEDETAKPVDASTQTEVTPEETPAAEETATEEVA